MTTKQTPRERIEAALRRAYSLGQTYWQQADSESISQHRKSEITNADFKTLMRDTADDTDKALQAMTSARDSLLATLVDCDNIAQEHGGCELQDCVDNDGQLYQSQSLSDALTFARAALAPTGAHHE